MIASVRIGPGSNADGVTITDLEFEEGTGVVVMAISGVDGWTFDPDSSARLENGATVLVRGPAPGVDRLRELVGDGTAEGSALE